MVELDGNEMSVDLSRPGVVAFGNVSRNSDVRFSIPFSPEMDLAELNVFPYEPH